MFAMVNLDEDMCKIIPLERAFVRKTQTILQLNIDRTSSYFSLHKILILEAVLMPVVLLNHGKIPLFVMVIVQRTRLYLNWKSV